MSAGHKVALGDNRSHKIKGKSVMKVQLPRGLSKGTIKDVHHVPGLAKNLLSIARITDPGNEIVFNSRGCRSNPSNPSNPNHLMSR